MDINVKLAKSGLESFLEGLEGLSHLKVRSRGNLLTLESQDEHGIVHLHARFRKRTVNIWCLEMPVKRGWEPTFMEGRVIDLMKILIEKFPWTLSSV